MTKKSFLCFFVLALVAFASTASAQCDPRNQASCLVAGNMNMVNGFNSQAHQAAGQWRAQQYGYGYQPCPYPSYYRSYRQYGSYYGGYNRYYRSSSFGQTYVASLAAVGTVEIIKAIVHRKQQPQPQQDYEQPQAETNDNEAEVEQEETVEEAPSTFQQFLKNDFSASEVRIHAGAPIMARLEPGAEMVIEVGDAEIWAEAQLTAADGTKFWYTLSSSNGMIELPGNSGYRFCDPRSEFCK